MVRTDEFPLPPSPFIRAALKTTVERIALELNKPQAHAPDWTEFEWRTAMAVAVMHGVSGMLAGRLLWRGPEVWQAFLAEQLEQGLLRQERTQQLLAQIDIAAREVQLPLMALKGSAILGLHLYAPGERPMSDIDLLCSEQDRASAGRLIEALGYEEGLPSWKHYEYAPRGIGKERAFGEHIANPIKIELHTRIAEQLPQREVAITGQVFPSAAHTGLNSYPSKAALMRHLLLHASGNMCFQLVRLIHLHDIAILAGQLQAQDWDDLLQPASWWMLPPLAMAERCFPGRIPQACLSRATSHCPPLLHWASDRYELSGNSLSRAGTPLLPGVEWSRSLPEAWACVARRVYPGREASALGKRHALAHPAMLATRWVRLPRWKRALSTLSGKAPRAITMYSLQQALRYRPDAASIANIASIRAAV